MIKVFAFDIDGTVMHSWRSHSSNDVCVEFIDNAEHGYMSGDMIERLLRLKKIYELVPVTSRSLAQYNRIMWPKEITPSVAFIDNGAYVRRIIDGNQYEIEDLRAGRGFVPGGNITAIVESLNENPNIRSARIVDEAYILAILADENADYKPSESLLGFSYMRDRKKAYFFPEYVTKANAIKYIRELYLSCYVVAAGDSANDLTMADLADLFLAQPKELPTQDENGSYEMHVLHCLDRLIEQEARDGI